MDTRARPFAIVTGASSGVGLELATCCARGGFDLLVASNESNIHDVAKALGRLGTRVYAVRADLAHPQGAQTILAAALGRTPDALVIEAWGSREEREETLYEARRADDRNTAGVLALVHGVTLEMRLRGAGRVLLTGSIDDGVIGGRVSVHDGARAFFDAFAFALRHELRGTGVNVTAMFPTSAETASADGATAVAHAGFDAMMRGQDDVTAGRGTRSRAGLGRRAATDGLAEVHPITSAK